MIAVLPLALATAIVTMLLPPAFAQTVNANQPADPDPCIAGEPCFTNVSDILDGRRHLLRTDDLVIAGQFGDLSAGAILNTNDSTVVFQALSSFLVVNPSSNPTVARARLFDLDHDNAVSAVCAPPIASPCQLLLFIDPDEGLPKGLPIDTDFGSIFGFGFELFSAAADFTGDGYDDIVFVGLTLNTDGLTVPSAIVVTAADPAVPSRGLRDGGAPFFDFASVLPMAMTTGDFTGSGRPVIAILGLTLDFQGAPNGLGLQFYSVDPTTLEIGLGFGDGNNQQDLSLPEGNTSVSFASIAAGRFGNTTHDQLAVTYAVDGSHTVKVITVDFDAQGNAVQKATADLGFPLGECGGLFLKSGRFDWGSPFDQAAHYGQFCDPGQATVSAFRMLTFDANLNPTVGQPTPFTDAGQFCRGDMAVGNFDRMQPNPNPPPATERDPNLQLAFIGTDFDGQCGPNVYVNIFSVDPVENFKLTRVTPAPGMSIFGSIPVVALSLAAADVQGRSLTLGAPTKVVIEHRSQASVVVAAPPMHVDYITPVGASAPEVFNLSAIPGSFFTSYQTDETSSNQSSTKSSTSWSAGAKETVEGKVTFGIPNVDAVTVDDKFSAQQAWKGSVENVHGTTSSHSFDVSQQTGFADQVWYDSSRINLYIYPVIGKTVCPAAQPDCAGPGPHDRAVLGTRHHPS